nr:phosphoribosyltransferase family protein [Candidatus Sigynarchaeota archaeon]
MYKNRQAAGIALAKLLERYKCTETIVLAIPNGGVAVGIPIAEALYADFGLLITKRIHFPFTTESGFGAITSNGYYFIDEALAREHHISPAEIETLKAKTMVQVQSKMALLGVQDRMPNVKGKNVILVDDGIAGGFSMFVSLKALQDQHPARKIVAVPTAPARSLDKIRDLADEIVCPDISHAWQFAVANAYEDWYDVSDDEVVTLLDAFKKRTHA